jgi:hypothetical protein
MGKERKMIPLRKVLESIEKGLEALTQKTRDMQSMLDKLEEALIVEEPKKRGRKKTKIKAKKRTPRAKKAAAKGKPKRVTATSAVSDIIMKSRKGVTTAVIKEKTGFDEKKIWNIINRLKKQGKIKSAKKGYYVKA